jgi:hypothetical protein
MTKSLLSNIYFLQSLQLFKLFFQFHVNQSFHDIFKWNFNIKLKKRNLRTNESRLLWICFYFLSYLNDFRRYYNGMNIDDLEIFWSYISEFWNNKDSKKQLNGFDIDERWRIWVKIKILYFYLDNLHWNFRSKINQDFGFVLFEWTEIGISWFFWKNWMYIRAIRKSFINKERYFYRLVL